MDSTSIDMEKARTSGDGMEEEKSSKLEQLTRQISDDKNSVAKRMPPLTTLTPWRRKDSATIQECIHARKLSTASLAGSSGNTLPLPGLHTLYRRSETVTRTLAPIVPKGELIALKPRMVATAQLPEHKKNKPPRFIPYEPYPGAVNPIVLRQNSSTLPPVGPKVNKNNLDIGVLVSQMSTMRTRELDEAPHTSENLDPKEQELQSLREQLNKMKEERDYFQGQFKFQTQVNSELKNLLVASVGEDLQTRVNVLTEDKLQLARALLDTANNLTTHTEQIEFLAGQCEVWRSKFLASSVMVEELARWKADLTQKNQMLSESTKKLLHTIHQLRGIQLEMLKNLKFAAKIRYLNLPAADVINLSAENLNILQKIVLHAGVGIPESNLNISTASVDTLCEAEKYAVQALEFISQPLMATDEAIRALFGQAQRPYGSVGSSASYVEQTIAPPSGSADDKNIL